MSMRDYAVDEYGLILDSNALKRIASQMFDDFEEENWEQDKYEYVFDMENVEYIGEFSGEALKINDSGETDYRDTIYYNNDSIFYVCTLKVPSLFHASYKNVQDLISESQDRLGKYLPRDFDYRSNIRHIVGTYYG